MKNDATGQTLAQQLTDWMRGVFAGVFGDSVADVASRVAVVPTGNSGFGDYQCNAAMPLAKELKTAPRNIAEKVRNAAALPELVDRIDIAGPGFINLYLSDARLGEHVRAMCADERLGVPLHGANRTVIMDYGSPNMTKPLHIGHLRSHNIGNALDRLHRFVGYRVIADNHLGDWGTQFGITIMGFREYGAEDAMKLRPLAELERVYVLSYERSREDEAWLTGCREELVKLQNGDAENLALWETFMRLSHEELQRVYARLGISYDMVRGESYYRDRLEPMVRLLEEKGLAVRSEGAMVVFLEDEKLPVCIVRKSDGGFNYATTDLATVKSRVESENPHKIVYVTDERQQLHFKQVFAVCRRLGYTTPLDHVWFGLMRLPEATFSTREGNVIPLEALLDKAEELALEVVAGSSPELGDEEKREIARKVGIGAVKYADLSQNPQSVVTFTWEKALSLEGNSGPYLQYAYARIASVQRKHAERFPGVDVSASPICLEEPVERALCLRVAQFPDAVTQACEAYRPNILTDYLFDLAQTYSTFYQNVPFLKAPEGVRESRVQLCAAVARVLGKGLDLLGIETPERI